MFDVGLM